MSNEIIAELKISQIRRWFGIGSMALVGLLALYVSATQPPMELAARILLPILGIAFLFQARWNYYATVQGMILTERGLIWENGQDFCLLEDINKVERGTFSFKPSNGFAIHLKEAKPFHWKPGLYWTVGRRIGVGGSTQPAEAKAIADMIASMITSLKDTTRLN